MAQYHAQVTLIALSADGADNNTNGFAVGTVGTPSDADLDDWAAALKTFYDTLLSLGALRAFMQNNHLVKFYDIDGGLPNYPVYETTFNLNATPAAMSLPMEVALAISYKNNSLNTVPRARRRGRIYISGFNDSVNTAGRPNTTLITGFANAMETYCDTINATAIFEAAIWSRSDGLVYPIEEVWVDNEWDTQRRRGGRPTARQSRVL